MRTLLALAAVLLLAPAIPGQDLPRPTAEGVKLLEALIAECQAKGAAKAAQAPQRKDPHLTVADAGKLRAVLKAQRALLTPALAQTLIGGWPIIDDVEAPFHLALMEAVAAETGDRRLGAFAALFRGNLQSRAENFAPALRAFQQAAGAFAGLERHEAWQAASLNQKGKIFDLQRQYEDAEAVFRQALKLYQDSLGAGHHRVAATQHNLGTALSNQGKVDAAMGAFEAAVAILKDPKNDPDAGLAAVYTSMAFLHDEGGRVGEAQKLFEKARDVRIDRLGKDDPETAKAHDNLGDCLRGQGKYGPALDCYRKAERIFQQVNPHALDAAVNQSCFAQLYEELGEFDHVIEAEQKAREIYERVFGLEDLRVARSLTRIGAAHARRGEYGKALDYARQSLALRRKLSKVSPVGMVVGLSHVGFAHSRLREYDQAADHYQQALTLARSLRGCPPAEIAAQHNNLGFVYSERGEHDQALEQFQKARDIYADLVPQDHPALLTVDANMAMERLAAREFKDAVALQQKVLAAQKRRLSPQHPEVARSYHNLAAMYFEQRNYDKTMEALDGALAALIRKLELPKNGGTLRPEDLLAASITMEVLQLRGRVQEILLQPNSPVDEVQECVASYTAALAVAERVRRQNVETDVAKLALGDSLRFVTPRLIGLHDRLFQQGKQAATLREAFELLERTRARVFLDGYARSRSNELAKVDPESIQKEKYLQANLRRLEQAIEREQAWPPDQRDAARVGQLQQERRQAEKDLADLIGRMEQQSPAYAALRYPRPCTLDQARAGLDENEMALLFSVGEDVSYVLLIAKRSDPGDPGDGLAIVKLDIGRQMLFDRINTLIQPENLSLTRASRILGTELYRRLLGPLAQRLGKRDLVIVPDGPLASLPFEMLVDPQNGHYLIQDRSVRYAPSLTTLHLIKEWGARRQPQPAQPLWAVGDPIFTPEDPRWPKQAAQGVLSGRPLKALPASGDEVRGLAKLVKADSSWVWTGEGAAEARVKEASRRGELAKARYVHFATHGLLEAGAGLGPSLVLTQAGTTQVLDPAGGLDDGILTLAEVAALQLNADLVVLSGCYTGQGRLYNGEGLNSLARSFLHAGTQGIVCSLWKVEDTATAELMQRLYGSLGTQSAARSLRMAKLAFIDEQRPPLFWAPYIHLGR